MSIDPIINDNHLSRRGKSRIISLTHREHIHHLGTRSTLGTDTESRGDEWSILYHSFNKVGRRSDFLTSITMDVMSQHHDQIYSPRLIVDRNGISFYQGLLSYGLGHIFRMM